MMDEQQFAKWVELLGNRLGMRAASIRKSFLHNAISNRLDITGIASHEEYFDYLHAGENGKREWEQLVELLTIRETRFFRHKSSLELVSEHAKDKLRLCKLSDEPFTYQAWSLGCSTGDEAYTLAILLEQVRQNSHEPGAAYSVIASDISNHALETARTGIYPVKQLSEAEEDIVQEYFTRLPDGQYRIVPEIREKVVFTNTNILHVENNTIGMMDVIFCQNLLIYFEHDVRLKILNNLARYLLPNGLIVLGAGEIYRWDNPDMQLVSGNNILAYRRNGTTRREPTMRENV